MKTIKLKNIYTGEVVICKDVNDTIDGDNKTFIKVFKEEHPQRIFLVNREAFNILNK